jgi:hypothetical protein
MKQLFFLSLLAFGMSAGAQSIFCGFDGYQGYAMRISGLSDKTLTIEEVVLHIGINGNVTLPARGQTADGAYQFYGNDDRTGVLVELSGLNKDIERFDVLVISDGDQEALICNRGEWPGKAIGADL